MQVNSLTISNCKSFKESESVSLDKEFTILVGPNSGGKSNTLDIPTITLRHFFLPAYIIGEGEDAGISWRDIRRQELFSDIRRFLDPHVEKEDEEVRIELMLSVGASDLHNLQTILENRGKFESIIRRFRNTPFANIEMLDRWNLDGLKEGTKLRYVISNGNLEQVQDDTHRVFREYLNALHFFLLLAAEGQDLDIKPTLLYFSPYRSAAPQDLRANLAGERFFNVLAKYFNSTSQTQTTLLKISSLYFAEKKRHLEVAARQEGYNERWANDLDVQMVSSYMEKLGYDWDLLLADPNKNIYEILLRREGRDFAVGKASSGEKEILNFLLGIFALRAEGGLILIDEPELHLHPRWQGTLRDLLANLASSTRNQIILCTHSPVFITPKTIGNIRRVSRDGDNTTRVRIAATSDAGNEKDLLHIINSHNNERVFFADKVLLVEGLHDRLVFNRLLDLIGRSMGASEVFEVVEVHGKDNFQKYLTFLSSMKIPVFIVADLDYALSARGEDLGDLFTTDWKKIDQHVLKGKRSKDRETLTEQLDKAINTQDLGELKSFWSYLKGRHTILRADLNSEERAKLDRVLGEMKKEGVFVLSRGEIEAYLPEGFRRLGDTIELLKPSNMLAWLESQEKSPGLIELESICLQILNVDDKTWKEKRLKALQVLREEQSQKIQTCDS